MAQDPKDNSISVVDPIFILPDELLSEQEMLECWQNISALLRKRAEQAKRKYDNDPSKVEDFYAKSMQYYAFGKLVNDYKWMTTKLTEAYGKDPVVSDPGSKGDLN